jgi:hypothetical protein
MFAEDLRFACRRLWRSRGFAIVAVAMLSLGIGVNLAMFIVANTALFKGFSEVRENSMISERLSPPAQRPPRLVQIET